MNRYQGSEQDNPILEHIRTHGYPPNPSLELPNLQNAYRLWNAAKSGEVPFLPSQKHQEWFGHSLFTANVKMYIAYVLVGDISNLFSPNPTRLVAPPYQWTTYEAPYEPYSKPEIQIERYSSFSTFIWHLFGALDVMTVGLAFLYDFRQGDPLKMDLPRCVQFLKGVQGNPQLKNLINVFKGEGLLEGSPDNTRCTWYNDLKRQRNYYTHVGFPMFYVDQSGEWRIPIDPRSPKPASKLADAVRGFCDNLFDSVHHFIGEVYGAAWADKGQLLPQ